MTLVIHGAPRTKKNSQRIARGRAGRPFVMQSRQHDAWAIAAVLQLRAAWRRSMHGGPLLMAVNLRARIYRERRVGDLGNYLAAICDALERAGVVHNDRLIEGFDGSRMLLDRHAPRVELELTPL